MNIIFALILWLKGVVDSIRHIGGFLLITFDQYTRYYYISWHSLTAKTKSISLILLSWFISLSNFRCDVSRAGKGAIVRLRKWRNKVRMYFYFNLVNFLTNKTCQKKPVRKLPPWNFFEFFFSPRGIKLRVAWMV